MHTTVTTVCNIAVLLFLLFLLSLNLLLGGLLPLELQGIVISGNSYANQFQQSAVILMLILSIGYILRKSLSNNAVIIDFSNRIYIPFTASVFLHILTLFAFQYGYFSEGILFLIAQLFSLLLLNEAISIYFKRYFLDINVHRILSIPYGLYMGWTTMVLLTSVSSYIIPVYHINYAASALMLLASLFIFFVYYLFGLRNIAATIPLSWSILGICRHINHQQHYADIPGNTVTGIIITVILLYIVMIWYRIRRSFQSY